MWCPCVGIGHGEPEPELWTGLSSVEGCIPLEVPMALFKGDLCVALGRERALVGFPILKDMGLVVSVRRWSVSCMFFFLAGAQATSSRGSWCGVVWALHLHLPSAHCLHPAPFSHQSSASLLGAPLMWPTFWHFNDLHIFSWIFASFLLLMVNFLRTINIFNFFFLCSL